MKPTFCPRTFMKILIVVKFVIIYRDSFILCRTIMGVCKNKSSLSKHSVKYLWGIFKIDPWKKSVKKITFSYVEGDFFQDDQFFPKHSSGKFVEQLICDSYFGERLICRAAISYNVYHNAYNAWSGSTLFVENLLLIACWKSKILL